MKKVFLAFLFSVLAMLGGANGAYAVAIDVSYTVNYWPPNPCVDSTLSGSIGLFAPVRDGFIPLLPDPDSPDAPCGGSYSGSFIFDATPGTDIYFSFEGAIQIPDPGPPDAPVFAFAAGTREGDNAVADTPSLAPLILLGSVDMDGMFLRNPGPPDLPLFAFSSPGTEVGYISVAMTPVPEPSTLILLGGGLGALVFMRRLNIRSTTDMQPSRLG